MQSLGYPASTPHIVERQTVYMFFLLTRGDGPAPTAEVARFARKWVCAFSFAVSNHSASDFHGDRKEDAHREGRTDSCPRRHLPVSVVQALDVCMPRVIRSDTQVLLSDSLTFSRQVNEAARNCCIPQQAWKAKDAELYKNPSSVLPPRTLLPSLPNAGPSAGVTAKRIIPLKRADKKSEDPGGAATMAVASEPAIREERLQGTSEGGWRAPEHFRNHGWLSEDDFNALEKNGVVCPFGCSDESADRVRVKVWKDEFHVVRHDKRVAP